MLSATGILFTTDEIGNDASRPVSAFFKETSRATSGYLTQEQRGRPAVPISQPVYAAMYLRSIFFWPLATPSSKERVATCYLPPNII